MVCCSWNLQSHVLMHSKLGQKLLMQKKQCQEWHWDTTPACSAALHTQPGRLLTTPCAECINKAGGEHVKPEGGQGRGRWRGGCGVPVAWYMDGNTAVPRCQQLTESVNIQYGICWQHEDLHTRMGCQHSCLSITGITPAALPTNCRWSILFKVAGPSALVIQACRLA